MNDLLTWHEVTDRTCRLGNPPSGHWKWGWKSNDPPKISLQTSQKWRLKKNLGCCFFQHHPFFATKPWFKSSNKMILLKSPPSSEKSPGWSMGFFMQIHIPATSLWLRRFGLPRWPGDLVGAIMPAFAPPSVNKKSNWPLAKTSVETGGVRGYDKPTSWTETRKYLRKMLPLKKTFNSNHGRKQEKDGRPISPTPNGST